MDTIVCKKVDEVYNKLILEPGIGFEISEYFTFDVPGAKFTPAYRNKVWDGKIRLFNTMSKQVYGGLLPHIEDFCKERGYQLEYETEQDFTPENFSVVEAEEFIQSIKLPEKYKPRDYQLDAFVYSIRNRRALLLSPTASGKSLIIYLLTRYYNGRTLIIVPTTALVHQLASDFSDYGIDSSTTIRTSSDRVDSTIHNPITITTWQSIYKLPKDYFKDFDVVIGDEAHHFKAKSLTAILTKMINTKYRFGFTGTLDGTQTHKLVLEGLFGKVRQVTTTAKLIEQQHISNLLIKCVVLKYPDHIKQQIQRGTYQQEIDFLCQYTPRNKFITNLALSLKGNTLMLFNYIDKHGKILYDMVQQKQPDRKIFFVHGGVEGEDRDAIREVVEQEQDAIVVASYGTFSTGINIRNLHSVIFCSPSKSRIRNLQSIGRGLRRSETKTEAVLFDIADNMQWKKQSNYTLQHFMERVKIYTEEKLQYKIYPVQLKE